MLIANNVSPIAISADIIVNDNISAMTGLVRTIPPIVNIVYLSYLSLLVILLIR